MPTKKIILGFGILISLFACGRSAEEKRMTNASLTDSTSNAFISSTAAVENNKDSTHKFIRTADLKFKVKSVIASTYDIEAITSRLGGFVTYTNLQSTVDNVSKTAINADSTLETTYYTVSNSITLRVPNTKLDTTLKEISKNIDYLDYRIIKADDVALQLLSNNLTQKRSAKYEQRLANAIDNRGKKLKETTVAEDVLLNKQEQADNAKVSNLSLNDQINFSTITLAIYQRQTLKRELISNDKNIEAYEPGFGSKMLDALKYGWEILASFIIFMIKLWGLILFGLILYILYRKFWNKNK
ncbi:MAG: DUF4349 domain-containing protein [Bacteroidetes bacterium]|nr:DUF4349 domain-containing protein [Bacteroidota bacterium]